MKISKNTTIVVIGSRKFNHHSGKVLILYNFLSISKTIRNPKAIIKLFMKGKATDKSARRTGTILNQSKNTLSLSSDEM